MELFVSVYTVLCGLVQLMAKLVKWMVDTVQLGEWSPKPSFNGEASEIFVADLCLFCCFNLASSEDSDGDSSDSESSSENNKMPNAAPVEHPARILSDEELNQLGAKILRAEMMGDEVSCFL